MPRILITLLIPALLATSLAATCPAAMAIPEPPSNITITVQRYFAAKFGLLEQPRSPIRAILDQNPASDELDPLLTRRLLPQPLDIPRRGQPAPQVIFNPPSLEERIYDPDELRFFGDPGLLLEMQIRLFEF